MATDTRNSLICRRSPGAAQDARAGRLLAVLTAGEGLSLREAVEACGGALSTGEASRLRRLAADAPAPLAGGG